MDTLHCRLATEHDIAFIGEVYTENIAQLHGTQRDAAIWKQLLSIKDHTYYIVHGQVPVAWFRTDAEDGEFWLGMLQVKPAFQRKGIGRYILSLAEDLAKKQHYEKIGIHTTQDNIAARTLYASAGYTVTEIGPCTTADGIDRVGYTFQKEL